MTGAPLTFMAAPPAYTPPPLVVAVLPAISPPVTVKMPPPTYTPPPLAVAVLPMIPPPVTVKMPPPTYTPPPLAALPPVTMPPPAQSQSVKFAPPLTVMTLPLPLPFSIWPFKHSVTAPPIVRFSVSVTSPLK